jgi:hypothetical protein
MYAAVAAASALPETGCLEKGVVLRPKVQPSHWLAPLLTAFACSAQPSMLHRAGHRSR